jgi:hypothetical protein
MIVLIFQKNKHETIQPLLGFLTRIRPSTKAHQQKQKKYHPQSRQIKPPANKLTSKMSRIQPRVLEHPKTTAGARFFMVLSFA